MHALRSQIVQQARGGWYQNFLQRPGEGQVKNVTLIPGVGIGPEITRSVQEVFKALHVPIKFDILENFNFENEEMKQRLTKNECILLGVINEQNQKYTDNYKFYKYLDLYANVTMAFSVDGIRQRHQNTDIVVIRENTEGEYSGIEHEVYPGVIESIKITTMAASLRIAEYAFEFAHLSGRKKVTAVHKANIMKLVDGMFLQASRQVAQRYPFIKYEEMIIDNCCMQLVKNPTQFDVMVMPNLYGSIVQNVIAGITGGVGMAAGASIGKNYMLYSQGCRHAGKDIAGKNIANPSAILVSSTMMLRHLGLPNFADQISKAVTKTIVEKNVQLMQCRSKLRTLVEQQQLINSHMRSSRAYPNDKYINENPKYFQLMYVSYRKLEIEDYELVRPLGQGAYSEVLLARNKHTGHESALKVINKAFLEKERKTHHVYVEKEVLQALRHPGIIKLFSSFETKEKLYFSIELLNDGDLKQYLDKIKLTDKQIQFYAAELLVILEYLHQNGMVHRDVKPENILMTKDKHLKLIDFGTTSIFDETKSLAGPKITDIKTLYREKYNRDQVEDPNAPKQQFKYSRDSSFVGTADYLSPELCDFSQIGPSSDLWALGCFIYQLYTHNTPFSADNEFMLFHRISSDAFTPNAAIPPNALSIIEILLSKGPDQRYNGEVDEPFGYSSLKRHPFFENINFENMWQQDVPRNQATQIKRRQSKFVSTMVGAQQYEPVIKQSRGSSNDKTQNVNQVIMKGIVDKEHGIMFFHEFSPRSMQLVIQNGIPYLIYINPQLHNKKTTIQLNQCTSCKLLDGGKFIVGDKNKKKYIFREKEQTAVEWVTSINNAIIKALL